MRLRLFVVLFLVLTLASPAAAADGPSKEGSASILVQVLDVLGEILGSWVEPAPPPPEPTSGPGGETDGGPENDPNG